MSMKDERYCIDKFHAESLENNPLCSSAEREVFIYLPPGYHDELERKYPVIYYLHGYSGSNKAWTITSENMDNSSIDWKKLPKKILKQIDLNRLLTFEKLDNLINEGKLEPFILVQPDGSLQVPNIHNAVDLRGNVMLKGSFYVNSPYSGNYMNYIVKDVINHVESNYRVFTNRENRAIMGGSMGGYGTLYITIHHPEKFIAAASLSPGNPRDKTLLNWKLRIPLYEEMFGSKFNEKIGDMAWADILDTYDLLFSNEKRLIPTIKRDENGNIIDFDEEAYNNWTRYDLVNLIEKKPQSLKNVKLLLNCAKNDEFGLTQVANSIHETLLKHGIDHEFDLYLDEWTRLSPHILGIGYHILDGIKFCLKSFSH